MIRVPICVIATLGALHNKCIRNDITIEYIETHIYI